MKVKRSAGPSFNFLKYCEQVRGKDQKLPKDSEVRKLLLEAQEESFGGADRKGQIPDAVGIRAMSERDNS